MHSLLAHIYHLALQPMWRAPIVAFAAALLLRLAGVAAAPFAAALALLAGWMAVQYPTFSLLPGKPVDRLPGVAAILLLYFWLLPRTGKRAAFLALPVLSVIAAWWLAGAPLNGPGIAGCVPVCLGVWAAVAVTSRLAAKDTGWSGVAAALALAGAITLAGGAHHWARAALVPACVAAALIGVAGAVLPLAFATMLTGCLTVLASDRGRFVPVDLAVLAPLLVWLLAPRIQPRLQRAGPALSAGVAALGSLGLTLAAMRLLAMR